MECVRCVRLSREIVVLFYHLSGNAQDRGSHAGVSRVSHRRGRSYRVAESMRPEGRAKVTSGSGTDHIFNGVNRKWSTILVHPEPIMGLSRQQFLSFDGD